MKLPPSAPEGHSFWALNARRPDKVKSIVPPEKVDVVIVGAGYTGLNAALVLLRGGASVAVFEKGEIGAGASGRNGGFVTVSTSLGYAAMRRHFGDELALQFWSAAVNSVSLVERVIAEEGIDCDFKRSGWVRLASKPRHYERFARVAEELQAASHNVQLIPGECLEPEWARARFFGALLDENSGHLHPVRYLYGLSEAVRRNGGVIVERTEVESLRRQGSGFLASHRHGDTSSDNVIIATNGYTGPLLPALRTRVLSIGSYAIVSEPLTTDRVFEMNPEDRAFETSQHFMNYFRITPDKRLLFGGRNSVAEIGDPSATRQYLIDRCRSILPQTKRLDFTHHWSGRLGFTADSMPHIGMIEGVYYALGYCGHGVPTATWCGQEIGRYVLAGKTQSPFAEIPHPRMPPFSSASWALSLITAYYRLRDRVR